MVAKLGSALLTVWLVSIAFGGVNGDALQQPRFRNPPRVLSASPGTISVNAGASFEIRLSLTNITSKPVLTRVVTRLPGPYGLRNELSTLELKCIDLSTKRGVSYTWGPRILSVAEASGRDPCVTIPAHGTIDAYVDVMKYCKLHPGRFNLSFRYNSLYNPPAVKPDKNAWHGLTNTVNVSIKVLHRKSKVAASTKGARPKRAGSSIRLGMLVHRFRSHYAFRAGNAFRQCPIL